MKVNKKVYNYIGEEFELDMLTGLYYFSGGKWVSNLSERYAVVSMKECFASDKVTEDSSEVSSSCSKEGAYLLLENYFRCYEPRKENI